MTRLVLTIDMGDIDPTTRRAVLDPAEVAADLLADDVVGALIGLGGDRGPATADHPVLLAAAWVEEENPINNIMGGPRCPACAGLGALPPEGTPT